MAINVTISINNAWMVLLRLPSHSHSYICGPVWTLHSCGVLTSWAKIFILGHSTMITSSIDGKLKVKFPEQKLERLGRRWSSKHFSRLKQISFSSSSLSTLATMTSCISSHSSIFIFSSRSRLLAVEEDNKFTRPWQFDTCSAVKFWKETEDATNTCNLPHSITFKVSRDWKTESSLASLRCLSLGSLDKLSSFNFTSDWGCISSPIISSQKMISSKEASLRTSFSRMGKLSKNWDGKSVESLEIHVNSMPFSPHKKSAWDVWEHRFFMVLHSTLNSSKLGMTT